MAIVSLQAQWTPRPSGTTHFLRDIFFPTPAIGIAVGDSGTIVRSSDAGETWAAVFADDSTQLASVYFPTSTLGFAAGSMYGIDPPYGMVLKTVDSGLNWAPCLMDSTQGFGAVYFVNSDTGYAGGWITSLRTTDGGISWDPIPGAIGVGIHSIDFPSPNVGYFVGGPDAAPLLYKTTDGGNSVEPVTNGFQSIKETCQFLNDSVGFMGGWYNPMLARTDDRGLTWTDIGDGLSQAWDLHFTSADSGRIVGHSGGWGWIFGTTNGGDTWNTEYSEADGQLEALFMVDEQLGFAAGSNGLILKNTNAGTGIHDPTAALTHLIIHPNPARDRITIEIRNDAINVNLDLELIDATGRMVVRSTLVVEGSRAMWAIPGSIPAGNYTLVLTSAGKGAIGRETLSIVR